MQFRTLHDQFELGVQLEAGFINSSNTPLFGYGRNSFTGVGPTSRCTDCNDCGCAGPLNPRASALFASIAQRQPKTVHWFLDKSPGGTLVWVCLNEECRLVLRVCPRTGTPAGHPSVAPRFLPDRTFRHTVRDMLAERHKAVIL